MPRFVIAFVATLMVVLSAAFGSALIHSDPEHVKPDHVARPKAGVKTETHPFAVTPLEVVGGDSTIGAVSAWVEGELEHERQVAAALADLARSNPVRSGSGSTQPGAASYGGDCAALSAELGLPESVLWRESRCSWDAYNATGCGGRGCLGPAQLDRGHFNPVSPWNGAASGSCHGLDPDDPAQYAECVNRLSSGGTNLAPWR